MCVAGKRTGDERDAAGMIDYADPYMSRQHAMFRSMDGVVSIREFDSYNGSRIM